MADHGFTYEDTTEDSECPFCGEFIPKGSSVCGKCQAVHGSQITAGGCFTLIILLLVAVYSFSMLVMFDSRILGVLAAAVVALGSFYLFTLWVRKYRTTKGWFR